MTTNRNINKLLNKYCLYDGRFYERTIRDFSKNENNGDWTSGKEPRWRKYTNGLVGLDYSKAGDHHIYVPSFDITGEFSWEILLLIRSRGEGTYGHILSHEAATRRMYMGNDNLITFDCGTNIGASPIPYNEILHIVAARDSSNNGTIHVNGISYADAAVGSDDGSGIMYVGDRSLDDRSFDGIIFYARTFSVGLSPHEIQGLYQESQRIKSPIKRKYFHYPSEVAKPDEKDLQIAYEMKRQGSSVIDVSGNGTDGTNSGASDHQDPILGSCLKFDGIKDEVEFDLSSFSPQQGSVSFWFKLLKPVAGEARMLLASALAGNFLFIYVNTSQLLYTRFGLVGSAQSTGYNVPDNKWHFIDVSWTSTHVDIHLDGNWIDDYDTTFDANPTTGHICANFNAGGAFINALVTKWKWQDAPRTEQEIKNDYQKYSKRAQYDLTLEDVNVSSGDEGGTQHDMLSNSGWRFGNTIGRFQIADADIEGKKVKSIKCTTAGPLYLDVGKLFNGQEDMAYGTWEFYMKHQDASITTFYFCADSIDVSSLNGYFFRSNNVERIQLVRVDSGSGTIVIQTDTNTFPNNTWAKVRVTRRYDGQFTCYLNGVKFTALGATPNPSTDNTYKTSKYIVLDLDANDEVALVHKKMGI